MADNEQQVVLLDAANLAENGEIVTIAQSSGVGGQAVSDDILQQALEEATESYGNTVVEYTPDNLTVVADGSVLTDHNTVAAGSVVVSEDSYSLVNAVEDGMETGDIHIQHDTVSVDGPFEAQIVESVSGIEMTAGTEMISVAGGTVNGEGLVVENPGAVPIATVVQTVSGSPPSPLGSSNNPIRIIQQGNQYTSMQQLTPEQLAQIMQVVQEQQLAKTTSAANGSTTLFNPQTQTRIIYRVIYPSELHAKTGGPRPVTIQVPQSMHHQKRVYRKRVKDEDADKLDGPELSREEKEQRKKQRPRTRAGRVSRPPKHMVQDYKHIHPLDWDEDYDDSDGGYSDFKMSDEEPEDETRGDETFVHGLPTTRPKNFKCETCGKGYIGQAGLSRHLMKNPGHEQASRNHARENGVEVSTDDSTQDSMTSMSTNTGTPTITVASSENPPTSVDSVPSSVPRSVPPARGGFVSRGRGRPPSHENTPMRRKARLKDLMRQCEDEELMEVVLPHLAKVITLWEFLLMKVERGRPLRPHIGDIYRQYEQLHKQVSKVCKQYLKPAPIPVSDEGGTTQNANKDMVEISEEPLAAALGLSPGQYIGQELPIEEGTPCTYKYLYATPDQTIPGRSSKRTIELVTPDELADNYRPRKRGPGRPPKYPRPGGGIRPVTLSPSGNKQVVVVPNRLGVACSQSTTVSNGTINLAGGDVPRKVPVSVEEVMSVAAGVAGTPRIVYVQPKPSSPTAKPVAALPTMKPASPVRTGPLLQLDPVTGHLLGGAGVLEGHQVITVAPGGSGQQVLTIGPASTPQKVLSVASSQPQVATVAPGSTPLLAMTSEPATAQRIVITPSTALTTDTEHLAEDTVGSSQLEGQVSIPEAMEVQDLAPENTATEGTMVMERVGQPPVELQDPQHNLTESQQDTSSSILPDHTEELISTVTLVEPPQVTQTEPLVAMDSHIAQPAPLVEASEEVPKSDSSLQAAEDTTSESTSLIMTVESVPGLSQPELLPDSPDLVKVSSEDQVITTGELMEGQQAMSQVVSSEGLVSTEGLLVNTEATEAGLDSKDGVVLGEGMEGGEVLADDTQQVYLTQGDDGQTAIINNVFQTQDGLVLIQNPDGTFQIHSDTPIAMETVQALLGVEPGSQIIQEEAPMDLQ